MLMGKGVDIRQAEQFFGVQVADTQQIQVPFRTIIENDTILRMDQFKDISISGGDIIIEGWIFFSQDLLSPNDLIVIKGVVGSDYRMIVVVGYNDGGPILFISGIYIIRLG